MSPSVINGTLKNNKTQIGCYATAVFNPTGGNLGDVPKCLELDFAGIHKYNGMRDDHQAHKEMAKPSI